MADKPNILVITSDQHRYDCFGASDAATRIHDVRTPHLDALCASGMSFTHAFTPIPVCCPARETFHSGVMPEVHGGLWNFNQANPIRGLSPDITTWPVLLAREGYRNVHVGKWHVSPDAGATAFGFEKDTPTHRHRMEHVRDRYPFRGERIGGVGRFQDTPLEEARTHRLVADAIEEIGQVAGTGSPWHVRVDFEDPHLACYPCEPFASMYPPETLAEWGNFRETFVRKPFIQSQQLRNWGIEDWTWEEWSVYLSGYLGMISQIDDAVGRLIRFLEDEQLTENTIIVYTTDHGDAAGSHRMMDKHYVMYDEVVRVPLLVRWDGTVAPGSTCDAFVSHFLDLGPTFLDAAGASPCPDFQGQSLLPFLCGQPDAPERDWIFSTYHGQQFGLYTQRMIRDRRFKYVWNATDTDELYDLETDPWELNNRIGDPELAETETGMRRRVHETFSQLGDHLVDCSWIRNWLTR